MRTGEHVATSAMILDLLATITGVDHTGSLGIVRDHAAYFSTGAKANHAADGGINVAEWVVPKYGTVRKASWTA